MNYVILNGVKSTNIKGLLIQSLPPISKPLIRTEVEEIDGRDGDIITKLGYSAYDKDVKIGLFGEYDVNEVIKYFDSEGTVTFSNEPDKYYKYEIIEQIDFERLIRFKVATVTFHVQPFKFSTEEEALTDNLQMLNIPDTTMTKNGITLTVQNGNISVTGTGSSATEFYLPIEKLTLEAGTYSLNASASGTGETASSIRLIGSVPSDADSFGGTYLPLQNETTASMDATLTESKAFNYVWFYITAGTTMEYNLHVSVESNSDKSLVVTNQGNTIAKPRITVHGSGTINMSLNGNQIFVIELGTEEYITIDSAQMEAFKDGTLKNRLVTGDYDNLVLNIGENTISWTGDVSEVEIENYSRWI